MKKSLYGEEIIPFILLFSLLLFATFVADLFLHQKNIIWVGRYWGYIGTLLIALSFLYSLRKHKIIQVGSPKKYLLAHEYLGWLGALMVLVHGGIHFNGLLAWLAVAVMLITVLSGLTGRILLKRSQKLLAAKKKKLLRSGKELQDVDDILFWESLAVGVMKKWRAVHIPITSIFVMLAFLHIIAVLVFWKW